ncbi:unnamed protein product [Pelagomonas calceolata]|uniref:Uncharacterized protein n=1 Tax=Pelagomonas calceolata TaxID=35677 RepID=A0A8J2S760_9STRA|nr:unnamed protein product [Pelagomonas calceolata]
MTWNSSARCDRIKSSAGAEMTRRRWGRPPGVVSFVRRNDTDFFWSSKDRVCWRGDGPWSGSSSASSPSPLLPDQTLASSLTPSSEFNLDRVLKLTCLRIASLCFSLPSGAVLATSSGETLAPVEREELRTTLRAWVIILFRAFLRVRSFADARVSLAFVTA